MVTKETKTKETKKTVKTPDRQKDENIEKIVAALGKQGKSPSQIGIILKDKHGVQKTKLLGKSITKILDENKIPYDDDLATVNKKIKIIEKHYAKNKQDKRAKRELVKFIGLRKKLERYNKKRKK